MKLTQQLSVLNRLLSAMIDALERAKTTSAEYSCVKDLV